MKLLKKSVPLWVVILSTLTAVGVFAAALIASWDISTTLRVKRTVSIAVYDVDGQTELTSINLGDFLWNDMKIFPGIVWEIPAEPYFVNNTDQTDFYVGFNVEPDIPGIIFSVHVRRGDQTEFRALSEANIYPYPIISPANDPNLDVQYAHWYLSVSVSQPEFGDYSPTLTIEAYDGPEGS